MQGRPVPAAAEVQVIAGAGIRGVVEGVEVVIGTRRLMEQAAMAREMMETGGGVGGPGAHGGAGAHWR